MGFSFVIEGMSFNFGRESFNFLDASRLVQGNLSKTNRALLYSIPRFRFFLYSASSPGEHSHSGTSSRW
jgi:hypothetical protein